MIRPGISINHSDVKQYLGLESWSLICESLDHVGQYTCDPLSTLADTSPLPMRSQLVCFSQ